MNLTRKTLRLVDLRVRHYLDGLTLTASQRLCRVHSIESLAVEHNDFKAGAPIQNLLINPHHPAA
jgi:hypothetical protein